MKFLRGHGHARALAEHAVGRQRERDIRQRQTGYRGVRDVAK